MEHENSLPLNWEGIEITKEWMEQFEAEQLLAKDCGKVSFKFNDLTGKEHEFSTHFAKYLIEFYKPLVFKKQ